MKKLWLWSISLFFVATLFGCGGGGGGGGRFNTDFVQWSAIEPPETVDVRGISQDANYTTSDDPPPAFLFEGPVYSTTSTATLKFDSEGNLLRIDVDTNNRKLSWNAEGGDIINDDTDWIYAIDSTEANIAIARNPVENPLDPPADFVYRFEYQTFGAWETGRNFSSGNIGAISMGAPTLQSAIPTTDTVTFKGNTSGIYIDATGQDYFAYSDLEAVVGFDDRYIKLTTQDTQILPVENLLDGTPSGLPVFERDLDWTGTSRYSETSNEFSFRIDTIDNGGNAFLLTGSTQGQFYGPHAEELGGVFLLKDQTGPTSRYYSGAYGAVEQPSVP